MENQRPSVLDPVPEGDGVEIRAFRGTRRSSVYRAHVVPGPVFQLLLEVAASRGLRSLGALGAPGPHKLDKESAHRLAVEVATVHDAINEPQLELVIEAILDVTRWCTRARGESWLTIVEPPPGR